MTTGTLGAIVFSAALIYIWVLRVHIARERRLRRERRRRQAEAQAALTYLQDLHRRRGR